MIVFRVRKTAAAVGMEVAAVLEDLGLGPITLVHRDLAKPVVARRAEVGVMTCEQVNPQHQPEIPAADPAAEAGVAALATQANPDTPKGR
jgi:hypothetical protein